MFHLLAEKLLSVYCIVYIKLYMHKSFLQTVQKRVHFSCTRITGEFLIFFSKKLIIPTIHFFIRNLTMCISINNIVASFQNDSARWRSALRRVLVRGRFVAFSSRLGKFVLFSHRTLVIRVSVNSRIRIALP